MRGECIGIWSETWREVWLPLIDHEGSPEDIFCERFGEPVLEPFRPDWPTPVGHPSPQQARPLIYVSSPN